MCPQVCSSVSARLEPNTYRSEHSYVHIAYVDAYPYRCGGGENEIYASRAVGCSQQKTNQLHPCECRHTYGICGAYLFSRMCPDT